MALLSSLAGGREVAEQAFVWRVTQAPRAFANVRRSALPRTLRDIAGCTVPPTHRAERDSLARPAELLAALELDFPVLVRPVDTHRGTGKSICRAQPTCKTISRVRQGRASTCRRFVEYRCADGSYRKYRVIIVDGEAFPYHLAISDV